MNVKKVIKDRGWTLEQVASKMKNKQGTEGVSQSSVSQLLNGNPSIDKLQEIARIIGVSLPELVSDGDESGGNTIRCPKCNHEFKVKLEVEKEPTGT